MRLLAVLLCAGALTAAVAFESQCDIHAPAGAGSLHRAADAVAARLTTSPITDDSDLVVCLGPGLHSVADKPVVLDPRHSHPTRRVVWRGTSGTVVSGGTEITGWAPTSDPGVTKGTYKAALPAALGSAPTLRQLWVNGARANRTQLSSSSFSFKATSYGLNSTTPVSWANPSAVEFVWPSQVRNWIAPRCTVQSVANGGLDVHVQPNCWQFLTSRAGGTPPVPTVIENAALPTAPGEFYTDVAKAAVYFLPGPGVDMSTASVWASSQQSILTSTGVHNHAWTDVTFSYSTWFGPNENDGYVPSQSGVHACTVSSESVAGSAPRQPTVTVGARAEDVGVGATGSCEPVGAVHFTNSSQLSFTGCSFTHHGAMYGLSIGGGSQSIQVSNCTFEDMSGGSVKLGNVDDTRAVSPDTAVWDTDYTLTTSRSADSAREFLGCSTAFLGYVARTHVLNNTIIRAGYTGVSMGWGWGRVKSFAANNTIAYNLITDVMQALVDGGCIYTLGPQPGSTVTGNALFRDDNKFALLYHDNGSSGFHTSRNVVASSPLAWAFFLQGCCNAPAGNISVDNIFYRSTLAPTNHCAPQGCTVDNSSVVAVPASSPWPAAAQAIISGAGAA